MTIAASVRVVSLVSELLRIVQCNQTYDTGLHGSTRALISSKRALPYLPSRRPYAGIFFLFVLFLSAQQQLSVPLQHVVCCSCGLSVFLFA